MRKIARILFVLCLLLALSAGAFAEDTAITAAPYEEESAEPAYNAYAYSLTLSGHVVAGETALVTAPYGGHVEPFKARQGDLVAADDTLFTIKPTEVYAPCDGTVVGLRPEVGDDAAFIQDRYGALLYLEPSNPFLIETDTKYAYNAEANHNIHIGEVVYIESRVYLNKSGVGYITAVDGENYTVEVFGGNLVLNDDISIFREPDFASYSKIGSGKIDRNKMVPITATGSVLSTHVAEGDMVRRGDLLLEMVDGTLPRNVKAEKEIKAGVSGIIASIEAKAGNKVESQQVLATLYPTEGLQVAAEIHELDIANVRVGDSVRILFLGLQTEEPIRGYIDSISALSTSETGDAQYLVYVSFETPEQVRMGMNATIYINE